jgi:hypothetical protein
MITKVNYKKVLEDIINACEIKGFAPLVNELKKYNITTDIKSINNYFSKETGYKNYQDFCRRNGYKIKGEFEINGVFKDTKSLILEDYKVLVTQYMSEYSKFPTQSDFIYENNLPSSSSFYRMLKNEKISYSEFNSLVGNESFNPSDFSYEYWLEQFISKSNELGRAIKYDEMSEYKLPSSRWYIKNCNNPTITNFNEFIEFEAKMTPRYNMTKEMATEKIIDLQKTLNRPLMKKDLTVIANGGVGESIVLKYWNSFNEMKRELGLEIVQESMMSKHKSLHDIKKDIARICVYVYENEGREVITQKDWGLIEGVASYPSCSKWLNEAGMSIREYISLIGFTYIEAGSGLNYDFKDGEHVKSQFEMTVSRVLKEKLNLVFEKDYFKEVRYKTFIPNYNELMDCDYVITYKGETIYVEVAGMLRDNKNNFINNMPISTSKSKEKYRQKLIQKEKMLRDNNLKYYILFPSDIQEDFILSLFQ